MQQSSETIAALASALAKAQTCLANPEKSLTARIPGSGHSEIDQSFRYASLAAGLEIVRKALGTHEIAIVQRTAVDNVAGLIRLTTILAHSSGEWIASEWPVCSTSQITAPRRMGAALTYARRYALFTLVGIAGEDDLDAPDLQDASSQIANPASSGNTQAPSKPNGSGSANSHSKKGGRSILESEPSADLRDGLLTGLAALKSTEEAVEWAKDNLGIKNSLTSADARCIEDAFKQTVATLSEAEQEAFAASPVSQTAIAEQVEAPQETQDTQPHEPQTKPRRVRDRTHLKFVASQPCVRCGRRPCDAHHVRFAQPRAMGRKVSDEFTVPLCRTHHRDLHRCGDEVAWWRSANIDPLESARDLWAKSQERPIGKLS